MVASKRLLATESLNHSRAEPEFFPLPTQALRIRSLILRVSPGEKVTPSSGVIGIASSLALLNPLLPPTTLADTPAPTRVAPRYTSARRSTRVPASSLSFKPTQTRAGPKAVNNDPCGGPESNISALAKKPALLLPPATSTRASGSSVAVAALRAVLIELATDQAPVAGS